MTTTCSSCKHLDATVRKPGPGNDDTGLCRYPAPVIPSGPHLQPWPFCKLTDWCSHWAAKS